MQMRIADDSTRSKLVFLQRTCGCRGGKCTEPMQYLQHSTWIRLSTQHAQRSGPKSLSHDTGSCLCLAVSK